MMLSAGSRLGVYEIVAPLGAGGMGEVYRAHDTKLSRSVAIKILPDAFASDPERLARFEREAKMLAALNHPRVTALYGMEEAGGRHFLVMELESAAGEAITFVEPFPPTGTKYQVGRGGRPQWSRDGTELFYVPNPGQFLAVAVRTRPSLTFASPVSVPRRFGLADPANARPYDIAPDGRIIGSGMPPTAGGSPGFGQIHVVLNSAEELKARVPTK